MMKGIEHLFAQIKENIAKIHGVEMVGHVVPHDLSRLTNRAAQICALDVVLFMHRKKYGNKLNLLDGKQALYHKLLMKYQWPLSVIDKLSLSDILLVLHDELQLELLQERAGLYLSQVISDQYPVNFAECHDAEWDPALSKTYLKNDYE